MAIFFTQGQSKLYPTVPALITDAVRDDVMSMSHRNDAFQKLFQSTVEGLKALLGIPGGYHIFFLGSATEAMERVIQNCVERESLHLVNGSFSEKFHTTAAALGKKALKADGTTVASLSASAPAGVELIAYTQNETSTGIAVPVELIHEAGRRHPEKLIAVDIVSSAPSVPLDFSLVDAVFFSVQKGFGLPAGLGVMIVSPRAMEKAHSVKERGMNVSWYHSFGELEKYAAKSQTPETPNVLGMYLLGNVVK
ncbi:MAG: aminotransferase class V-fold PLP-dependent enzyme, partial [Patescibacteria group bacterium]